MGGFTPCLPYTKLNKGGQGRATTQDKTEILHREWMGYNGCYEQETDIVYIRVSALRTDGRFQDWKGKENIQAQYGDAIINCVKGGAEVQQNQYRNQSIVWNSEKIINKLNKFCDGL